MNVVAISIGHNKLDHIKRRIQDGHTRASKSGADWVEGSLEVAAALREGRELTPANISFSGWLVAQGLAYYNHQDRAALIGMASDIEVARAVLAEATSRSYQTIWAENRSRFTIVSKTKKKPGPRIRNTSRRTLFRTMKLGEETMARIAGTSLDNSAEMDELVMLNRGAMSGTLTEIVRTLIEDAAAGKNVSAIAVGAQMMGHNNRRSNTKYDLVAAWKKRMVAPWSLADQLHRIELLVKLAAELDQIHRTKFIERIWDIKS